MVVSKSSSRIQSCRIPTLGLATKDAHETLSSFGFIDLKRPERWMERPDLKCRKHRTTGRTPRITPIRITSKTDLKNNTTTLALIIIDGWGYSPNVKETRLPWPHTLLR